MLLRFLFLLLAGVLTFGCTRPPVPVPISVSTTVPARLVPVRFTLTGQVLDAETRQPVAHLRVRGRDQEVITDLAGRFSYATLAARDTTRPQELSVRTPQYIGQVTYRPGQDQQLTLLVQRRLPPLQAFVYEPNGCLTAEDRVHFNPQALLPPLAPGQLHAWLIDGRLARPGDTLWTITLRGARALELADDWREPLRLRILAVDPVTHGPGPDLLLENQLVAFPAAGRAFTFDLRGYDLRVPENGFYLGLELYFGDHFHTFSPDEEYRPQGRMLRAPCAFAATRSWTSIWKPGTVSPEWKTVPAAQQTWPLFESLITLEADQGQPPLPRPGRRRR